MSSLESRLSKQAFAVPPSNQLEARARLFILQNISSIMQSIVQTIATVSNQGLEVNNRWMEINIARIIYLFGSGESSQIRLQTGDIQTNAEYCDNFDSYYAFTSKMFEERFKAEDIRGKLPRSIAHIVSMAQKSDDTKRGAAGMCLADMVGGLYPASSLTLTNAIADDIASACSSEPHKIISIQRDKKFIYGHGHEGVEELVITYDEMRQHILQLFAEHGDPDVTSDASNV